MEFSDLRTSIIWARFLLDAVTLCDVKRRLRNEHPHFANILPGQDLKRRHLGAQICSRNCSERLILTVSVLVSLVSQVILVCANLIVATSDMPAPVPVPLLGSSPLPHR